MSNLWRKIEGWLTPVVIIGLFLLLLLWGFAKEARADVQVEIGPTILSGQFAEGGAFQISESFGDYRVGIGYISEQWVTPRKEPRTFVPEVAFVQGFRVVELSPRWSLGIGVAMFNIRNGKSRVLGGAFNYTLRVQAKLSEHWSVNLQHNSNAGSRRPNMGQDALLVGYAF